MNIEDIKAIKIEDFDYPLPDERIARHPLADRDACKLLVYDGSRTSHRVFRDLPDLLPKGSLLVMNNTRVINARMEFFRESGARIEIFLLEPLEPRDYALAFQTRGSCKWQCLVGNLKKWKEERLEKKLLIDGKEVTLSARRGEPLAGGAHAIEFSWDDPIVTFASVVEAAGYIPIPPYLKRASEATDATDYQTVYSRIQGSVAAPTAGLHFTPQLLQQIRDRGVATREVTLHVGAGTFQPVKCAEIGEHPMHTEVFEVELPLVCELREALQSGRQVMAVGTTTVRTLESLPILGIRLMAGDTSLKVGQWDAYDPSALSISTISALLALEEYMKSRGEERLTASTAIMIAPGFKWRIVSGLVTNFHQPQSTLLLLVSSLLDGEAPAGHTWRQLYSEALAHDYRFLSYGDACLFFRPTPRPASQPERGQTTISLPGSKSLAARALVCRLLGHHDTVLGNLPDCDDTRGMLRLTEAVRTGLESRRPQRVDIGEGGTTLRFGMAACASLSGLDITLEGSPRLMQRPHGPLIEALRGLGARLTLLPEENAICIEGMELAGGDVTLDGDVSSQYLSALMLAAPEWRNNTTFHITPPVVSAPYIRMTAGVMRDFGAQVSFHESPEGMTVKVAATGYAQCARFDVEGDWSGASYFFETRLIMEAAGMPAPQIEMPALRAPAESLQGDSRVAAIFADAYARLRSGDTTSLRLTLTDAPDLVPAIAVGLCLAGMRFRIDGVEHLHHKECDRMTAIASELRRLGYVIKTGEDTMEWDGEMTDPEPEPLIRTYKDHRMAMAFAPARILFPSLRIEDPGVVAKSFPNFWEELAKITNNFELGSRAERAPSPFDATGQLKTDN